MNSADLHLHTVFSDSTYTPVQLVETAQKAGLTCIALVDHDTVKGIKPLLRAAKSKNIEVLPGIELSAEYEGQEIHILGYLIDYNDKRLIKKLRVLRANRIARVRKIAEKLKGIGISLKPRAVFALARGATVGRMHVALAMVKEGLVKSTAEAFARFIGDKGPAYVLDFKLSPSEAISLIRGAGGIPVLAHPYLIKQEDLMHKIINEGIMGLEVYYPQHSKAMVKAYLKLAGKYNLLVTGGSDCHGSSKPFVKIGSVKIPYDLVEKLKEARLKNV